MKKLLFTIGLLTALAAGLPAQPVPVSHIMVCCRSANAGTHFLVNGKWNGDHDCSDIEQARDIFQKIKDAGINIVSVDFTNPSMWNTGDVPPRPVVLASL